MLFVADFSNSRILWNSFVTFPQNVAQNFKRVKNMYIYIHKYDFITLNLCCFFVHLLMINLSACVTFGLEESESLWWLLPQWKRQNCPMIQSVSGMERNGLLWSKQYPLAIRSYAIALQEHLKMRLNFHPSISTVIKHFYILHWKYE